MDLTIEEAEFNSQQGFFSFPLCPDRLWGTLSYPSNRCWELITWVHEAGT
jgi:hypothetical protein